MIPIEGLLPAVSQQMSSEAWKFRSWVQIPALKPRQKAETTPGDIPVMMLQDAVIPPGHSHINLCSLKVPSDSVVHADATRRKACTYLSPCSSQQPRSKCASGKQESLFFLGTRCISTSLLNDSPICLSVHHCLVISPPCRNCQTRSTDFDIKNKDEEGSREGCSYQDSCLVSSKASKMALGKNADTKILLAHLLFFIFFL